MAVSELQSNLNAGEISPELYGQISLAKYSSALTTARNVVINYRGGAFSRGGLAFVGRCRQKPPIPPRPIPFQFSISQGYILEFGDHYIRFVFQGGYILEAGVPVLSASNANPCAIGVTGTPFANGDWVFISGVGGMTQLNGNTYVVAGAASGSFTLVDLYTGLPVDATAYGVYTSGGVVSRIYEISSPYAAVDLPYLKFSQSADVMSLTLSNPVTGDEYPPYDLTRLAANNWTLIATNFSAIILPPAVVSAASQAQAPSTGINATFAYVVTAIDSKGNQSIASASASCHGADIEVEGGTNQINWSFVSGASYYNIFRSPASVDTGTGGTATPNPVPDGSIFGFVGSAYGTSFADTQSVSDLSQTPPTHQNPFASGQIEAVNITGGGSGQTALNYSITTASGIDFVGFPVLTAGSLGAFIITDHGEDYAPGDSISFNGAGFASGAIEFGSTNPMALDTITLNGVVWTFVATISGPQQTVVGGSLGVTLTQLAADLSASSNGSLIVASYAVDPSAANLLISYRTAGTAGNAYTLAASRATPSASTLLGGSGSGSAGAAANGVLTFTINPTAAQTIILDGVTWTFVASGATGNQTNLGVSLAATLVQLNTDLTASANANIALANYTHTATTLGIVYKAIGTGGNSYTLAGGTSGATPSAATLTGGTNASSTPAATLVIGPVDGVYPGVNTYFQQRHFFANSLNNPDTFWASRTGLFRNFDTSVPTRPTDAITASPWTEQVNGIQWLVPMPGGLIAMTGNRAWQIIGEGSYQLNVQAITPSTVQAQPQAFNGSSPTVPPIVVDYDVLYVEAVGNTIVRDLSWNFYVSIYTGADLTILSSHLFLYRAILQWAWARLPYKVVWCACDDGTMLSLTYLKEQEVWGWARHDTQGLVVGVASVSEPPVNALYAITQRFPPYSLVAPDSVGGAFVMSAEENYDPATVALLDAGGADLAWCNAEMQGMGYSYDHVRRTLYYTAQIATSTDNNSGINNTGFTLWDGQVSIAPSAALDYSLGFNLSLMAKNVDTGVVTAVRAYSAANTVPAGIGGGDGTWRRFVRDTFAFGSNLPLIVNPHTGDLGFQTASCEFYIFRSTDGFHQTISPLFPVLNVNDLCRPIGVTTDWWFVSEQHIAGGHENKLYLVPTTFTSDEIAADSLLTYATYDFPVNLLSSSMRLVNDHVGGFVLLTWNETGTRDYKLYQFDPPTSAPFGGPVVGGGFTDVTPWDSTHGPNDAASAYVFANFPYLQNSLNYHGCDKALIFFLPASSQVVTLTKFFANDGVSSPTPGLAGDPANMFVSCTNITGIGGTPAFSQNTAFLTGYLDADFAPTSMGSAVWVLYDIFEVNPYLGLSNFDYGVDYSQRWLVLRVIDAAVYAGGASAVDVQDVFTLWQFGSGAPALLKATSEQNWDTSSSAAFYAANVTPGVANLVDASMPTFSTLEDAQQLSSILFDYQTGDFWIGSNQDQMFNFSAYYQTRGGLTNPADSPWPGQFNGGPQAPLLKLGGASSTPFEPGIYTMERMDNRTWQTVEDAYAVDSGVSNPLAAPATPLFASAAAGTGIVFTSVAAVFSAANVGQILRMGGGIAEITAFTDTTHVIGDWVLASGNSPIGSPYAASGEWSIGAQVASLHAPHLAGMTLVGLADGVPLSGLAVAADGTIALPFAASNVKVGLPYTAQLQTPYMNGQGVVQGGRKAIQAATVRVAASATFQIGTNQPDGGAQNPQQLAPTWVNMTQVDFTQPTGGQSPPAVYTTPGGQQVTQVWTGDWRIVGQGNVWNSKGQVAIQQTLPMALEVVLVAPEGLPGDTPETGYSPRSGESSPQSGRASSMRGVNGRL